MNIFKKIRYKLWVFTLKKSENILSNKESINWERKVNRSNKFLICMPSNKERFNLANQYFNEIILKAKHKIDIVYHNKFESIISQYNYYDKKYLYPKVENNNKIPIKKGIIENIDGQYDIAIDLNVDINILSNFITATKSKQVSIGFSNQFSEDFLTANIILKDKSGFSEGLKTICKLAKII